MTLTRQYLTLTRDMCKEFYKTYYWDSEEEYADLDADFFAYTDMVGSRSEKVPRTPRGPLLLEDGMVARDIDDIWTTLERQIPKSILLDFWRNHREDYNNKETYRTINLRHYYRKNYGPEVYKKEQEEELEKSKESIQQIGEQLDNIMGNEKGTFLTNYEKLINEHTQKTTTE